MAASDLLRSQLRAARQQKDDLTDEIKDLGDQYDSLILFIPEIETAKGSVSSAVNNRRTLLSDLAPITKDCDPAGSYCKGMNSTLSGIGVNVVLAAMGGLKLLADGKKLLIQGTIKEKELELVLVNAQISTLETELKATETVENALFGSSD